MNSVSSHTMGVDIRSKNELMEPLLLQGCSVENESTDKLLPKVHDGTLLNGSKPKSRNIKIIQIYTFLIFSARSIWTTSVLSAFVYIMGDNDPKAVGLLSGLNGIAQLLTGYPAGVLADKFRRDVMLKIAFVLGMIAATATIFASIDASYALLGFGLAAWGAYDGFATTSIIALFADSIYDGDRSHRFTQYFIIQHCANLTGSLTSLLCFHHMGNKWTLEQCTFVIVIGQIFSIPAIILLCFVSDDYCVNNQPPHSDPINDLQLISNQAYFKEQDVTSSTSTTDDDELESASSEPLLISDCDEPRSNFNIFPVLVVASDMIIDVGGGISVRYFPIFFLDYLKMTPVHVQLIFMCNTISMISLTKVSGWFSKVHDPVSSAILFKYIGICMTIALTLSYQCNLSHIFISVLFILRTGFMHSTSGLMNAVLMDTVPKNQRAKWSSLAINLGGRGGAYIGGFLVDWKGIQCNFYVTSIVQSLGTFPLIYLRYMMKSKTAK